MGDLGVVLVSFEKRMLDCFRCGTGVVDDDEFSGAIDGEDKGFELGTGSDCTAGDAIVYILQLNSGALVA